MSIKITITKTLEGFDEMSEDQIIEDVCADPDDFFDSATWDIKRHSEHCICPKECVCEYRDDGSGFRGHNAHCQIHNTYPTPLPRCSAEVHRT